MNNWANYIRGNYAGPVIQVNNATELHALQSLAERCRLEGYEYFKRRGYKEILHILKINYDRLHPQRYLLGGFYRDTKGGKSFLVEYSNKGFTFGTLHDYDNDREDPEDWKIVQMTEILDKFMEVK